MKDKLKELRELSTEEIVKAIHSSEEELMKLRFRHAAGQLEQTAQMTTIRRQVAQARTVLNEKQREALANL